MANDLEAAMRLADEKRREQREAEELTEKRRHELRVARFSSVYAALITAAAAIAAAVITALWKAEDAGAKINSNVGASTSVVNNIRVGFQTFSKLTDPSVPISDVVPRAQQSTTQAAPMQSVQTLPPSPVGRQVTQAPGIDDAISTDSKVLDSCFGITPLKPQRILVEAVANGYNISIRAQNTSKSAVSVWAEGLRQLNDNIRNEFPSGGTNLPGPSFHTFDKPLDNAFSGGETIQPGDAGPLTFEFSGHPNSGSTVTLHANLDYVLKDESGQFTFQHANLSCQNLPVMSTVKQ